MIMDEVYQQETSASELGDNDHQPVIRMVALVPASTVTDMDTL